MISPNVSQADAEKVFPEVDIVSMPSGKEYVRSVNKY